jgi:hypothetical protein
MKNETYYVGAQNDALYITKGVMPARGNDDPVHDADRTAIAKVYNIEDANLIAAALNAYGTDSPPLPQQGGEQIARPSRGPMTHSLKTDPIVFQAVFDGSKTHEIRLNDRDFRVGDTLNLIETESSGDAMRAGARLKYTGRAVEKRVSHVLSGYGLHPDWVILSFAAVLPQVGEATNRHDIERTMDRHLVAAYVAGGDGNEFDLLAAKREILSLLAPAGLGEAKAVALEPKLSVWCGSMPESNGKSNFTAILHKGDITSGITIDRSEYPERVRYEADRMRYLIGEIDAEPFILNYDSKKHSGYAVPVAQALPVAAEKDVEIAALKAALAIALNPIYPAPHAGEGERAQRSQSLKQFMEKCQEDRRTRAIATMQGGKA